MHRIGNRRQESSRRCKPVATTALSVLILSLLLSACGGTSGIARVDSATARELNAGLPRIAELKGASGTSIDSEKVAVLQSAGCFVEIVSGDKFLRMNANDGGPFEWAIFNTDSTNSFFECELFAGDLEPEEQLFIAVSNFQSGTWDFSGPFVGTDTDRFVVPLDDSTCRKPGEGAFVAVISPLGSDFHLSRLDFRSRFNDLPNAALEADVTTGDAPLVVNLDASASSDPDGSLVSFEWDFSGDGGFDSNTGTVPTESITYSAAGVFSAVVRVTDNEGASSTAVQQIIVTENGNIPPIPILEASPLEGDGEAGFSVDFGSDASNDMDGTIELYEWDLDSDSTTGTNGFEVSSPTPDPQQVTYNTPGEFTVRLRVTDNGGLRKTDTKTIVSHGWIRVPVSNVTSGQVADSFSLARIGKGPAFAYRDSGTGRLHYSRSSTVLGLADSDWSTTITDLLATDRQMSLAEVNDKPAVAFTGGGSSDISYAHSSSASGANPSDWTFLKVDIFGGSGASLAVVDGFPAISFIEDSSDSLKYALSSTVDGSDPQSWTSIKIADASSIAFSSSLTLVGGNPAIAWFGINESLPNYMYARSDSINGADPADWQQVAIDAIGNGGFEVQLDMTVVDGTPAMVFRSLPVGFAYVRSQSSLGLSSSDWQGIVLDAGNDTVEKLSMAVVGGRPMVLLDNQAAPPTHFLAVSSTADGGSLADWQTEAVTDGETLDVDRMDSDVMELDGYAAVVFFDDAADEVVYAIRF